jgi:DNA-binding transcriptional MerR regulator
MYVIREIARKFGLSRATLLYYDRIGLLKPKAISESGYRLYDEKCVERLKLICTYKNAGLSLKEVKTLLDTPESPDEALLQRRILELDREIARLKTQQRLLIAILKKAGHEAPPDIDKKLWVEMFQAAGLSEEEMHRWHVEFERRAPHSHHAFLEWLGIPEREVVEICSLSRSIKENLK